MANGILYFTAGDRRAVVAVDAGNGETLWVWRMDERERHQRAPRRNSGRGVAYWADGQDERIIVITPGFRIVALNAQDRHPGPGFRRERDRGPLQGVSVHRGSDRENRQHLAGCDCAQHDCRRPCPAGRRACQQGKREGRHHGLRRPHGQEKVGRSYDSAKGRGRLRNVAERLRRIHGERRNVGAVLRRPGTRLCLSLD